MNHHTYILVPETKRIREGFKLARLTSVHFIVLEDRGMQRTGEFERFRKGRSQPEEGTENFYDLAGLQCLMIS